MTVELSSLIHNTRLELSDIPEDHASDEIVYQSLSQAVAYIGKICDITVVADSYLSHCYVCLSAYYTYLNYTALAEKKFGASEAVNYTRLAELKDKARVFLSPISNFILDANLNISSTNARITPISTGLITSVDG